MIKKYGKSVKMKRINRTIDGIKQQIETCQANAVKYHRNKSGGQCRVCGSVSSQFICNNIWFISLS